MRGQEKDLEEFKSIAGFQCIDLKDEDPYLIFGDASEDESRQTMEVMLAPCNYVGAFGEHSIPPDCNADIETQKKYIGSHLNLDIMTNLERLDL